MNRLAEVLSSPGPTHICTVNERLVGSEVEDVSDTVDAVELRVDRLSSYEHDYVIAQARRFGCVPVLATIRSSSEGGEWTGTETERLRLFNSLLDYVEGVDAELSSESLPIVTRIAHNTESIVVVSSHDFEAVPADDELEALLSLATENRADYLKVAASARNLADYQRLADFALRHRGENVIVVAMDNYGPLSRIALPGLGSRMTYSYAGEQAAPGQLDYRHTAELLHMLYPQT